MSLIFEKIAPLADLIAEKFEKISTRVTEPGIEHFDWYNKVYTNYKFRRAHIAEVPFKLLGCVNVNCLVPTVTMYVSPASRPSN